MARQRKEKPPKEIKLRQPDRSAPTEKTLLDLAHEKNLFQQAARRERELAGKAVSDDEDEEDEAVEAALSPGAERFLESLLWTSTLAMLHFTFDVLVMNQYGTEISWPKVWSNTFRSWFMFFILFYPLHPHVANPNLIPGLPRRYQQPLRQTLFFAMSVLAGCYLIYVTNSKGYLFTMKRAPPLACLWLWAVVELDLLWAVLSLVVAAIFLWQGEYKLM